MKRNWCKALLNAMLLTSIGLPAHAQLGTPNVPGVALPNVSGTLNTATRDVQTTADNALATVNARAQAGLRAARVRELLRDNRDTVEADPNGAPIVRSQLVGLDASDMALARIAAAGFGIAEDRPLAGLGVRYVIVTPPAGLSTRRALARLRALDPEGSYDYNHLYIESGTTTNIASQSAQRSETDMAAASGRRIGLIDGGIAAHQVLQSVAIHRFGCDGAVVPSAHGTAVASLMTGQSADFHSAAPGALLYAADVYCGKPTGGALRDLANAFSWLAQEQVPVINISLVGPPNVLLEKLVRTLIARGYLIVAAVGNDGPAAKPLYPAAYPGVIGVTAVDARNRVLVEAVHGKQVTFAAPGADIAAAGINEDYAAVRGTSFAAPIVAGLLSFYLQAPDCNAADAAVAQLSATTTDLGARGIDQTYGKGLVGQAVRESLAPLLARVTKTAIRD